MKTITPFVLAALFCAGSAAGAQGLQSVVGVPVTDLSAPPAQLVTRVLKARWVCHGGGSQARSTKECKNTSADWLAQAEKFCKIRCLKLNLQNPTRVGKCGVNTFETSSPCP